MITAYSSGGVYQTSAENITNKIDRNKDKYAGDITKIL